MSGDAGWSIVLPIKRTDLGKSRLGAPSPRRTGLAFAMAADTVAATVAAHEVAQVIVVTDDDGLARHLPAGVRIVPDPGRGLNAAMAAGVALAGESDRAALLADLPALRPGDLDRALRRARLIDRAVVADADGTGSTLVTARRGVAWLSAFGPDSFDAHLRLGCVALDESVDSTLRHDVDTMAQLELAAHLGLGTRTASWWEAHAPHPLLADDDVA